MKKMEYYVRTYIMRATALVVLIAILMPISRVRAAEAKSTEKALTVELTAEEQQFVDRKQEVVIGCPVDTCPLLFQDEGTGEIKGITADVLSLVSESTGLRFKYMALPSGRMSYEKLEELGVDVVASVEDHSVNEHASGIAMTDPYLKTAKVFVCKKGVVLDENRNMVIAVVSGSRTLAMVLEESYPNFRVDYYSNTHDALKALRDGEADAVLQNQYCLQRILAKPIYEDLQVVDEAAIGDYHCLAALVPIDGDGKNIVDEDTKLLLSVINKGIDALDEDEVSFIIIKESAENTYTFTIEDFMYRYRYAIIIIGISAVFIVVLLWQVITLQRKHAQQLVTEKRARELAVMNEQMQKQQILLKDALAHAEEGNKAKTSFLFHMSHDIRTPMNAILGLTTIALNHREDPVKVIDSLQKIDQTGKHLMQLLGNVLDMTRIEKGEPDLEEGICDLYDMIDAARSMLHSGMDEKKLTLDVDVKVKNRKVYCDELRVTQIILNLLSNAVNYSKQDGAIEVSLRQSDSEIEGSYVYELRVKDDGVGMSKEFQKHIFEPFEREKTSTISGVSGMGLGLSITKSLVDLMGGTISVSSEPDKGSEFIVTLIFKAATEEDGQAAEDSQGEAEDEQAAEDSQGEAEDGQAADSPAETEDGQAAASQGEAEDGQGTGTDFSGRRLLVVEDNEINAEIICEILGVMGFLVETAENGQIAVDMVQKSEPGYYDFVLMDIQMPVMDGYQATREIRRLEEAALANIPIIAMTANVFEEDKRNALASGMNAHLSKPVDIDKMVETFHRFL